MPQLQYDYDYYTRRNNGQNKKVSGNRSAMKNGRSISRSTIVSEDAWKNNRASIRKVLDSDDDSYIVRSAPKKVEAPKKVVSTQQKVISTKKKSTKNMQKPEKMSLKKAEVMMDSDAKARVKVEKRNHVLRNIMYALCSFSILFLICYRSSVINESFKSVSQMKSNLENIRTVNAQIESEIQTQTDLSNIEMYAKYQLGMQKPKEAQIKKVFIEKADKISTPIVVSEEKNTSFWEKLMNDIVNIMD